MGLLEFEADILMKMISKGIRVVRCCWFYWSVEFYRVRNFGVKTLLYKFGVTKSRMVLSEYTSIQRDLQRWRVLVLY